MHLLGSDAPKLHHYHLLQSLAISSFLLSCVLLPAQTSPQLSGDQIIERASPALVLILAGSGDGKVAAIGSGLIVRSDGIVLTANHVVKGMKEVQIRLKNDEVYDRVEMIAADERRDITALRIPATDLPVLPVANFADVPALPCLRLRTAPACLGPRLRV